MHYWRVDPSKNNINGYNKGIYFDRYHIKCFKSDFKPRVNVCSERVSSNVSEKIINDDIMK